MTLRWPAKAVKDGGRKNMQLLSLQRWHWIAVGLLVGLACGGVREAQRDFSDELRGSGRAIASRREFEEALVTRYANVPRFKDLLVYPHRLPPRTRGGRDVHLVRGNYFDGTLRPQPDGRMAARWEPAYYIAPVPYRTGGAAGAGESNAQTSFPSVREYLSSLRASAKVEHRYAYWWWTTRPLFVWSAGAVLLIGLVWPTVINLLTFGNLGRPARQSPRRCLA